MYVACDSTLSHGKIRQNKIFTCTIIWRKSNKITGISFIIKEQ